MWNPDYQSSLDESSYMTLNQNQLAFASDFYPSGGGNGTFTSLDPRLIDPVRGFRMELNAPAFDGTLMQADRYDATNVATQTYTDYSAIQGGQVFYYLDAHLMQPYASPNFQLRTKVEPVVFQDPMGALKPDYRRQPLPSAGYISGYRNDQDEISFREDLMALQMRRRNRENFQLYQNSFQTDFPLTGGGVYQKPPCSS